MNIVGKCKKETFICTHSLAQICDLCHFAKVKGSISAKRWNPLFVLPVSSTGCLLCSGFSVTDAKPTFPH
jgi:hypothetical protein